MLMKICILFTIYFSFITSNNVSGAILKDNLAAGDCKGGGGTYITYYNVNMGNSIYDVRNIEYCFAAIPITYQGCHTLQVGNCACTTDHPPLFDFHDTFNQAYNTLKRDTKNFISVEAERHEGSLYLTYTCVH